MEPALAVRHGYDEPLPMSVTRDVCLWIGFARGHAGPWLQSLWTDWCHYYERQYILGIAFSIC